MIDADEGEIVLAPGVQATLVRDGDVVRLELTDGRYVTHERGAGSYLARIDESGRLGLDIFSGAQRRTVEVEDGIDFDISIRRGQNVLSYVFGQPVTLDSGRYLAVTHAEGLRTYLAEERGGR